MNQNISRSRNGSEDAIGILLVCAGLTLAFCWFVAVSRFHMRNPQCLELFLYFGVLGFGALLAFSHFIGRWQKREENWLHPPGSVELSSRLRSS